MNDAKLGRKFDSGKLEYGLIPPYALKSMVEVLTMGAKKYARDNWKYVPDAKRRYYDALQRHLWAWKAGEQNDPEDNMHHLAHAMCCLFFLYEKDIIYDEEGNEYGKEETKDRNEQNEVVAPNLTREQQGSSGERRTTGYELITGKKPVDSWIVSSSGDNIG